MMTSVRVRGQALVVGMLPVSLRDGLPAWLSARARKAFQLANQEAHRLGHRAVGIEHLFLGLAKEGTSPGARALRFSGFTLAWLRGQVEEVCPPGSDDEVLPGSLPYTRELTAFVERTGAGLAGRRAVVEPQHLLAGLVRGPGGRVGRILRRRWLSWLLLRWWLRGVAEPGAAADRPRDGRLPPALCPPRVGRLLSWVVRRLASESFSFKG